MEASGWLTREIRRTSFVQAVLWLSLGLALAGSIKHVAWAFATLENGDLVSGYIQALAVDAGLFGLAFGIQRRKKQKRHTRGLWGGVVLFSLISAYANLLHGLAFATPIPVVLGEWSNMQAAGAFFDFAPALRPFLLSSVLPLLVIYLTEVVSEDREFMVAAEARREKREGKKKATGIIPTPEQAAIAREALAEQRALSKQETLDMMVAILQEHPDISPTKLAKWVGRSRSTVYNYLNELEESGRIHRNGGIKVSS